MLNKDIEDILTASKGAGWVLEPEAKRLLAFAGLEVPQFKWARSFEEALHFAGKIGYPVVAKIVSPKVIHKTDLGGVFVDIDNEIKLSEAFQKFSALEGFAGMLVEETLTGIELIVGAKIDYQFGPVILMGIGGIWAEIYGDTTLRMAPLDQSDAESMVKSLKAHDLLEGYRGSDQINLKRLTELLMAFSGLIMELEGVVESVDLNPVICSSKKCVVADARIVLTKKSTKTSWI